jgi:hypothetical protein
LFFIYCLFWAINVYVGYTNGVYAVDCQHQGDCGCRKCFDEMTKLGFFSAVFGLVALIWATLTRGAASLSAFKVLVGALMLQCLLYSLLDLAVF